MPDHIEKRRRRYYAVLDVPADARAQIGQSRLRQSLQTESLTVAQRRAPIIVALWKRRIEKARGASPLIAEAERWKQALAKARGADDDGDHLEVTEYVLGDRMEEVQRKHGDAAARLFMDVARGEAVMIEDMADRWLAEAGYTAKVEYQNRRALALLYTQFKTVAEMNRRTAGAFVTDVLAQGRRPATVNRILNVYSALWRWLVRRGHVESNPWRDQRFNVRGNGEGNGNDSIERRPFTEEEAKAFMASLAKGRAVDRDIAMIAAVTGMRLEEVAALTPSDVSAGKAVVWLTIQKGKTAAAARRVPVVAATVRTMLTKRKAAGKDRMFHELTADRWGDYGASVSLRMGRKLRSSGLTDPALVADHSWRHRARTLMEHADVQPWVADALLGHARPGEGLGRYSAGPSDAQLVEAVKAIALPA
jgi:integrase